MARQNPDLLINGPKRAKTTIVLAHGAGAGMDTRLIRDTGVFTDRRPKTPTR